MKKLIAAVILTMCSGLSLAIDMNGQPTGAEKRSLEDTIKSKQINKKREEDFMATMKAKNLTSDTLDKLVAEQQGSEVTSEKK